MKEREFRRRITSSYYNYYYNKFLIMLKNIALQFAKYNPEFDDYFDVASRTLLYAMIIFNRRRASLTTWVHICVNSRCIQHNRIQNLKKDILISEDILDSSLEFASKPDLDLPILIEELLTTLTPTERNVLIAHYFGGETLRETAKNINTSYGTINQIRERALKKIRKCFPEHILGV